MIRVNFRCLAGDFSYRDETLRERFVLHATKNRFQSSWRFLKFSGKYIQIGTFMYAITSHKKRRVKYETEMLSRTRHRKNSNSGKEVKLQAESITSRVSSEKTPWLWTPMSRHSTAIMPMGIHKQAWSKKKSASKIRKISRRQNAKARLCLHTVAYWTFIYTSFLLFWILKTDFKDGL